MVRKECPSLTGLSGLAENLADPAEKILPIRVIRINSVVLNPTSDNMVQHSGGIGGDSNIA
jgi:hypothetical protein